MKLTTEQKQEIADQQAQKHETKRVTSPELEKILYEAIKAPVNIILSNAGIEDYSEPTELGYGLNVVTGDMVDMIKSGIIDPLLVTKSALNNAASVATTILSTDCVINNLRLQS